MPTPSGSFRMRILTAFFMVFWRTVSAPRAQWSEWRRHDLGRQEQERIFLIDPPPRQVLKFVPMGGFRGDYSLHYQYRLSDFCAVQAGGGLSLRDPLFERFAARQPWHAGSLRNVPSGGGRLSIRWFPRNMPARMDFYIAQEYLFRNVRFHFTEELPQPDGSLGQRRIATGYSYHSLRLLVGWQTLSVWHFHLDLFTGLAFSLAEEKFPQFVNGVQGPAYHYRRDRHFFPGFVAGLASGYVF